MRIEYAHRICAEIDPDKLAAAFDEEFQDYQKTAKSPSLHGFVRESAEIMGSDIFDGPWADIDVEDSEFDVWK